MATSGELSIEEGIRAADAALEDVRAEVERLSRQWDETMEVRARHAQMVAHWKERADRLEDVLRRVLRKAFDTGGCPCCVGRELHEKGCPAQEAFGLLGHGFVSR